MPSPLYAILTSGLASIFLLRDSHRLSICTIFSVSSTIHAHLALRCRIPRRQVSRSHTRTPNVSISQPTIRRHILAARCLTPTARHLRRHCWTTFIFPICKPVHPPICMTLSALHTVHTRSTSRWYVPECWFPLRQASGVFTVFNTSRCYSASFA